MEDKEEERLINGTFEVESTKEFGGECTLLLDLLFVSESADFSEMEEECGVNTSGAKEGRASGSTRWGWTH